MGRVCEWEMLNSVLAEMDCWMSVMHYWAVMLLE